jgi:hypothetical protein
MSNFIQLEQSLRRFDPDSPRRHVNVDADVSRQRDQYFTTLTVHHQPAAASTALNPNDRAYRRAIDRLHGAADQLMLVVAARLERLQRGFRNSQLEPGEPFDRFDAGQPFEADDRPAIVHARRRDRELFVPSLRSRPQRGSRAEPFGDEVSLGIDHHIAAETVWPGHATHDSHVVPISHDEIYGFTNRRIDESATSISSTRRFVRFVNS